jgi:hypothetical protein
MLLGSMDRPWLPCGSRHAGVLASSQRPAAPPVMPAPAASSQQGALVPQPPARQHSGTKHASSSSRGPPQRRAPQTGRRSPAPNPQQRTAWPRPTRGWSRAGYTPARSSARCSARRSCRRRRWSARCSQSPPCPRTAPGGGSRGGWLGVACVRACQHATRPLSPARPRASLDINGRGGACWARTAAPPPPVLLLWALPFAGPGACRGSPRALGPAALGQAPLWAGACPTAICPWSACRGCGRRRSPCLQSACSAAASVNQLQCRCVGVSVGVCMFGGGCCCPCCLGGLLQAGQRLRRPAPVCESRDSPQGTPSSWFSRKDFPER